MQASLAEVDARFTCRMVGQTAIALAGTSHSRGSWVDMLDTLTIAQRLQEAGVDEPQAKAITEAVKEAAERGHSVTRDMLRSELALVRAEIAGLGATLTWPTIGVVGLGVAVIRLWN